MSFFFESDIFELLNVYIYYNWCGGFYIIVTSKQAHVYLSLPKLIFFFEKMIRIE